MIDEHVSEGLNTGMVKMLQEKWTKKDE